jgi:6-phosphogluconolactonase
VTDSPKPPPERVSLTFAALNRSAEVWFVVTGAGKAGAVAQALATGDDAADVHHLPAAGVSGHDTTVWFLDEDAAAELG